MRCISILIFVTFSSLLSSDAGESPQDFADRFYTAYKKWNIRGVPYLKHEKLYSSFYGIELIQSIRRVNIQRKQWDARNPKTKLKPPWCPEGDFITSTFEGFDTHSVGSTRRIKGRTIVNINLRWRNSEWTDQLILERDRKGWVIADIRYSRSRVYYSRLESLNKLLKEREIIFRKHPRTRKK